MQEVIQADTPIQVGDEAAIQTEAKELNSLSLDELRAIKSECDEEIILAIARRQVVTDEIGVRKSQLGERVHLHSEEVRVLKEVSRAATEAGLNPRTVTSLWVDLFRDSRDRQKQQRRVLGAAAVSDRLSSDE